MPVAGETHRSPGFGAAGAGLVGSAGGGATAAFVWLSPAAGMLGGLASSNAGNSTAGGWAGFGGLISTGTIVRPTDSALYGNSPADPVTHPAQATASKAAGSPGNKEPHRRHDRTRFRNSAFTRDSPFRPHNR
jgi:hypothetical protein